MSGLLIDDDYLDPDVAYLLGLIVARGRIIQERVINQIIIDFPYGNLHIEAKDLEGTVQTFDVETSIQLGLGKIRERILDLLNCDIAINSSGNNYQFVLTFTRKTIGWRNIMMHLANRIHFTNMEVPETLFHPSVTSDIRLEFIRGYADVAANIRRSNNYYGEHNRARLDVLNDNWNLPVQLCRLLQQYLEIPVQSIIWGHPSLGRDFREHMINIFVTPFQKIGSTFQHKQQVLDILVEHDQNRTIRPTLYAPCPGRRRVRKKDPDIAEQSDKLPESVRGHFDGYWQICKVLGCTVEPASESSVEASQEIVEED